MPIPDFQSLMLPALKALSDGAEKPVSEIRNHIAKAQGLTPEEMQELLPSGRQPVFVNRVSWALIHLSSRWSVRKSSARRLAADAGRREAC